LRVGTELLRQFQIINMVFPDAAAASSATHLKVCFEVEAAKVKTLVQDGPITDIIVRIEKFWIDRRGSIQEAVLSPADLTGDALLAYLWRRARRQLGWFIDSKSRLEHIAKRRTIALITLYCAAILFALGKHVLLVAGIHASTCLVPPLLIATGMSAAMTAYYINQNSRSLVHRYNTQQRTARRWLQVYSTRWNNDTLAETLSLAIKKDIRAEILRFEDFMIEELVDWVHITSHDAIELAP
jgi:hypothetical protein